MLPISRLLSFAHNCMIAVVLCSVAGAVAATPAVEPRAESVKSVSEVRRSNICFGGLEDGKLIPNNDEVENPFTQTTLLGCSVEGGQPVYLPDLEPAIPNGVLA